MLMRFKKKYIGKVNRYTTKRQVKKTFFFRYVTVVGKGPLKKVPSGPVWSGIKNYFSRYKVNGPFSNVRRSWKLSLKYVRGLDAFFEWCVFFWSHAATTIQNSILVTLHKTIKFQKSQKCVKITSGHYS